jgi:hypothetical protein
MAFGLLGIGMSPKDIQEQISAAESHGMVTVR